jgi:hypothetical protein
MFFLALPFLPFETPWAFPHPPIYDYKWVDEDTSTGRMYVSMDPGILADTDSLVARLREIAARRSMDMGNGKPIKVALFSDERFAHPKWKVSGKDRRDWAGNYLADFDTRINELFLFPALPSKRKKIALGGNP